MHMPLDPAAVCLVHRRTQLVIKAEHALGNGHGATVTCILAAGVNVQEVTASCSGFDSFGQLLACEMTLLLFNLVAMDCSCRARNIDSHQ